MRLRDFLSPRRLWLRWRSSDVIQAEAARVFPAPYSAARLLQEARLAVPALGEPETRPLEASTVPQPSSSSVPGQVEEEGWVLPVVGAAEVAGLATIDVVERLAAIDSSVYDAMGHLTGKQIDSLADMQHSVEAWKSSALSGVPEGTEHMFAGHVGEVDVARHLEALGVRVDWPGTSNQEGWDLVVQGHAINVKLLSDTSGLAEHFDRYPHIPVVVAGDTAHVPDGAVHLSGGESVHHVLDALDRHHDPLVIVDDRLSAHDIGEQATHSLDASTGDWVKFHIPKITLFLSGIREFDLLLTDKTTAGRALLHMALDVGGTGGGGFLGAKLGAVAGALAGPVGAVVGAIAGGIAGALLGRSVTNEIKQAPLQAAVRRAKAGHDCLQRLRKGWKARLRTMSSRDAKRAEGELRALARQACARVELAVRAAQTKMAAAKQVPRWEAIELLKSGELQIEGWLVAAEARWRAQGTWRTWIWPSAETLGIEDAMEVLLLRQRALVKERAMLDSSNAVSVERAGVYDVVASLGVCEKEVVRRLTELESARLTAEASLRATIKEARDRMVEGRRQAMQELLQAYGRLVSSLSSRLSRMDAALLGRLKYVEREKGALGVA
jgi:hypothetical protein